MVPTPPPPPTIFCQGRVIYPTEPSDTIAQVFTKSSAAIAPVFSQPLAASADVLAIILNKYLQYLLRVLTPLPLGNSHGLQMSA